MSTIKNQPTSHSKEITMTFAQKMQQSFSPNPPNKNTALIITQIPNIYVKDHILALGNVINPQKITHADKLSLNRICVYLRNENDLTSLLSSHKTINVNGQITPIRSYISTTHRLNIWALPVISNNIIVHELQKLGQPTSDIYAQNFGITAENFQHIQSFRKFIFIEEEYPKIPEFITVTFQGEQYKIYFAVDATRCSSCQKFGHTLDKCNKHVASSQPNTPTQPT